MSSATLLKTAEKRVKTPVETDSKSECEVSSSSRVNDTKSTQNSKERTKENISSVKQSQSDENTRAERKSIDDKMSSESTIRNPLAESASISHNNESNRKNSNGNENKTPKAATQNETNNNNNNPKLRARPAKKSPPRMSACGWCSDTKPALNFILPTLSGENLQFCTEMCIAEFRKAVKKGACKQCGSVVRPVAPNKEYCSLYCMNKAMPKNGKHFLKIDLKRNQ